MTRGVARKYISDVKSGKIRSNAWQKRGKPAETGNENEIEKETKV